LTVVPQVPERLPVTGKAKPKSGVDAMCFPYVVMGVHPGVCVVGIETQYGVKTIPELLPPSIEFKKYQVFAETPATSLASMNELIFISVSGKNQY
jgi:hypothetical protein